MLLGVWPTKLWLIQTVDALPAVLQLLAAFALPAAGHPVLLAVVVVVVVGDVATHGVWRGLDGDVRLCLLLVPALALGGRGGLWGTARSER